MIVTQITAERRHEWNSFVAQEPAFALLQSWEWGEFKEKLGWKIVRIAIEQDKKLIAGAQVLIKPLPLKLASLLYIPRGPLVDWNDQEQVRMLLDAIHAIGRQWRAICLKIEPALPQSQEALQALARNGFHSGRHNNQPQATIVVDLTAEPETMLARMRKSTRRNITRSQRDGVTIREGTEAELPTAIRLLHDTAKRAGFSERSVDYYHEEWKNLGCTGKMKISFAVYEERIIAMSMDAIFGDKAASFHGASLDEYRHLKANDLLIWGFMQRAKAEGCVSYDLWGIPDEIAEIMASGEEIPEDQDGGLWGVYNFKKGFGGNIVCYVGIYDFVYIQSLYWIMNFAVNVMGSMDALAHWGDLLKQLVGRKTGILKFRENRGRLGTD
jgi:lipid II:glycine glycyltransferase (peptidoglycan interpeptide bridge formation enzyme)